MIEFKFSKNTFRREDGTYDEDAAQARIKKINDAVATEHKMKTKRMRDHLEDIRTAKELGIHVSDFT